MDCALTQKSAGRMVALVLKGTAGGLERGGEVGFGGFGTFKVCRRAARRGRHPHTGEMIPIAESSIPAFTPAKKLKERFARDKNQ